MATQSARRKVKQRLADEAANLADDQELDVVIELTPITPPEGGSSRSRMDVVRRAFADEAEHVERTVNALGGIVIGSAWINQTLRSKLPKRAINELAEDDRVMALDAPSPLTPD